MRKIIALALCMILVCSALSVSAASVQLPDGGRLRNTGVNEVTGRTSLGTEGQIEVRCTITGQGFDDGYELVTAYTEVFMPLDLRDQMVEAYTSVCAWYTDENNVGAQGGGNIGHDGTFPMQVRYNGYGVEKGTAGHNITSEACGDWICGTTVYAQQWIWPYSR